MKKFLLIILIFISVPIFADSEHYLRFKYSNQYDMNLISTVVSIDNVVENYVYAYSNDKELDNFKALGIDYEILTNPSLLLSNVAMVGNSKQMRSNDWNVYPTYDAYVEMMNSFAADYSDYCEIMNIGKTVKNRDLLVAKITADNGKVKPSVFLASTMHGDETTGYVLMLRLIDYLLSQYGVDQEITKVLDSTIIYINPLHNPDGTYARGNSTVIGSTRANANYVDLNRNFPDPFGSQTPTGEWQPETIAFMNFAKTYQPTLSMNIHGGVEVINYPWDSKKARHADDAWFIEVARQFATLAQSNSSSPSYFTDLNNGITNGYDWYYTSGSRQDYVVAYTSGRELTAEISTTKLVAAAQLPTYWGYLKDSFIQFIKQANHGIKGQVTDNITNQPVHAKITLKNHDKDESLIFTNPDNGWFFRLINNGTYTLEISAEGYITEEIEGIDVVDGKLTEISVKLVKEGSIQNVETPIMTIDGLKNGIDKYVKNATIKLSCPTAGAKIHYSIDNDSYQDYTNDILINKTQIIKFYASKNGMNDSEITTKNIQIVEPYQVNLPYQMIDISTAGSFDDWGAYNVAGYEEWENTGNGYISFNQEADNIDINDDWLISPQITGNNGALFFSMVSDDIIIPIYISNDYDGFSNPTNTSFKWNKMELPLENKSENEFYKYENIPISINGTYHIAFRYNNLESNKAICKIKDISVLKYNSIDNVSSDNNINAWISDNTIMFSNEISSPVTITDITGRVIEQGIVNDANNYKITSKLRKGIYIVSFILNEKIESKKIFYQNSK